MIRRSDEKTVDVRKMFDGAGEAVMHRILNGADEMYGKGRVCSILTLDPDCEIGRHKHEGDCEVFLILSGTGKYLLDGELVDVEPGDILFVDDGEEHYMLNDGMEPLVYVAIVLFTK